MERSKLKSAVWDAIVMTEKRKSAILFAAPPQKKQTNCPQSAFNNSVRDDGMQPEPVNLRARTRAPFGLCQGAGERQPVFDPFGRYWLFHVGR